MSTKYWILATTLSILMAVSLLPVIARAAFPSIVTEAVTITASAIGLKPLDIARLFGALMALHYAVDLPELLAKCRTAYRARTGRLNRMLWSAGVALPNVAIRVAVPVVFCVLVEGAPHVVGGVAALAA